MMAESGGNPTAYRDESLNPGGGKDMGLFQINSKWHPEAWAGTNDMYNPEHNIREAARIFKESGWGQWTSAKKALANNATTPAGTTTSAAKPPVVNRNAALTTPMFTSPMKSSFDRAAAPAGMNDLKSSNINDRIAALKSDINGGNLGSIS